MTNTSTGGQDQTANTPPDPNAPGGNQPPDPNAPGGSSGGSPTSSSPDPNQGPAGAQTVPEKPPFLAGIFGGIVADFQKERELKRELKRAKQLAQQTAAEDLTKQALSQPEKDDENLTSEEMLRRERNKRIQMISEFTDVKETFDHKLKRHLSGIACLLIPWLLVLFLTSDIGQYFAGQPFTFSNFEVLGVFGLVALLEVAIAVVTNAWGNSVHDANATEVAADKQRIRERAKTQMIAWGILSLVSGFALFMFLLQQQSDNAAIASGTFTATQITNGLHAPVSYALNAIMINVVLRVIGTLAIDPACVFAVHTTTKNLDQFLKMQNQITTGITQISDSFDKQQEAAARAEMRQKENERFLELKGKMDDVNATMFGKMGEKMLSMSDQMFDQMQLPPGRIIDADDDDSRNVRRLRR